jgi:hypothetical protein
MKLRDIALTLVGSSLLYVAMAACSSGGGSGTTSGIGPHAGDGGGSPGDGGLIDVIMNPVPDASAEPQSGTRLKAVYRVADDGSKEFVPGAWFDTMRQENCSFVRAADGKDRCLPQGLGASAFSDSACTKPIVATASGCAAPKYALGAVEDTCSEGPSGLRVFAVGAVTTPATIYVQSGSQCFPAGAASTGATYYEVGAEIPASSFTAAATKHD